MEKVVTYFKVLYQHLPGKTEGIYEKPIRLVGSIIISLNTVIIIFSLYFVKYRSHRKNANYFIINARACSSISWIRDSQGLS